jgi:MFS family permease
VLLVAVPFGKLADRFGRRKLLVVCLLGVACSFAEVFVVCKSVLNLLVAILVDLLMDHACSRRSPAHVSSAIGVAVVGHSAMWWRVVFSGGNHVGYGC